MKVTIFNAFALGGLSQQLKDTNKIYSLHEPDVYCIGKDKDKDKDHKPYEYGNKISVAATAKSNIIVGVVSHECNCYDNHTLPEVLSHLEASRGLRMPSVTEVIEAKRHSEKPASFYLRHH